MYGKFNLFFSFILFSDIFFFNQVKRATIISLSLSLSPCLLLYSQNQLIWVSRTTGKGLGGALDWRQTKAGKHKHTIAVCFFMMGVGFLFRGTRMILGLSENNSDDM